MHSNGSKTEQQDGVLVDNKNELDNSNASGSQNASVTNDESGDSVEDDDESWECNEYDSEQCLFNEKQ